MSQELGRLIEELRWSLGKHEIALNAIPLAILYTDLHGRIEWCNAAFERLADRRRIDILGATFKDFLTLEKAGGRLPWSRHPANPAARIKAGALMDFQVRRGRAVKICRNPMVKDGRSIGLVLIVL